MAYIILRVLALVILMVSLGTMVYSFVQSNREKISDKEENAYLHLVIMLMCLSSIIDIVARGWLE